jgi:acetyltransferase-like isoleucine patch superfamily enzyme
MTKNIIKKILLKLKPIIRRLANLYKIKLLPDTQAEMNPGINKLILKSPEIAIPPSVYFNTMSGDIIIGEGTIYGINVQLITGTHLNRYEAVTKGEKLHQVPKSGRDIIVGDNCFLGSSCIIIGPCVIGDDCLIGAGAIVTKDVPSGSFVVGPEAKVKSRYTK